MADEAAALADDAASMAEVAAAEAAPAAADVSDDMAGGVTMVVVDGAGAGVVVAAGGVTTVSSFLLQAAKETAVASVTISSAVFMFLLGFGVRYVSASCGNPLSEKPPHRKARKRETLPLPSPRL